MSAKHKTWMGLLLVVLAGAAVFALTAPEDNTRFVSARRPGGKTAAHRRVAPRRSLSAGTGSASAHALAPTADAKGSPGALQAEPGAASSVPALDVAAAPRTGSDGPRAGQAARRNLFRPLVAPARSNPALMPLAPGDLGGLLPLPDPSAPGAKRRREYWRYVGTVGLDGATYALVEEQKSKAGVYVKQGDAFRGGHIGVVRPDYVVIAIGGQQYRLPKATGLEEEPAEKPAPAAPPGAPAQPVAGQQPPQPGVGPLGGPPAEVGRAAWPAPGMGDGSSEWRRGRRRRERQ